MLAALTNVFQAYQEYTSKDEMVFGELISYMIDQGRPMVNFSAAEGYQRARFLMHDEILYTLEITLDKKIGSISTLNLKGTCRNQVADPDDMIAMFKTDVMNILKMPMFGQMKINHEFNSVHATVGSVRKLSEYMASRTEVKREMLGADIEEKIKEVREALRKFKK